METLFLSRFKNLIALKSAYRAAIGALALSIPGFLGFSVFTVLAAILGSVAVFFHVSPDERPYPRSWFFFSALFLLGSWWLSARSTFFEFFGFPQVSLLVLLFAFLFLLLRTFPGRGKRIREEIVFGSLLFLGALFPLVLFGRESGAASYFTVFLGISFIGYEMFSSPLGSAKKKLGVFSFFSGLVAAEMSFLLSFLPFSPFVRAAAVAGAILLFSDAIYAHKEGFLRPRFVIEKGALFLGFCVILGFLTHWSF